MIKTIVLEVVGERKMACEGCQERVESVLGEMQGVRKVRAQARTQRVEVLFDSTKVELSAISGRLREAGYESRAASQ